MWKLCKLGKFLIVKTGGWSENINKTIWNMNYKIKVNERSNDNLNSGYQSLTMFL